MSLYACIIYKYNMVYQRSKDLVTYFEFVLFEGYCVLSHRAVLQDSAADSCYNAQSKNIARIVQAFAKFESKSIVAETRLARDDYYYSNVEFANRDKIHQGN